MVSPLPRVVLVLLVPLALGACNQTSAPPAASAPAGTSSSGTPTVSSNVTPSGFHLPKKTKCSGSVNRFRALMDNDLATGHVARSVYDQITKEIDSAAALCSAGNDAGARSAISASRARHGYPAG